MAKKIVDVFLNPKLKAKIIGDAGEYPVWGVDWINQKYLLYRASEYVWIPFHKVRWFLKDDEVAT